MGSQAFAGTAAAGSLPPELPATVVSGAVEALLRLEGAVLALPAPEGFIQACLRNEAVLTCRLYAEDRLKVSPAAEPESEEVVRCLAALDLARGPAATGRSGPAILEQLHAKLTGGERQASQRQAGERMEEGLEGSPEIPAISRVGVALARLHAARAQEGGHPLVERAALQWMLARVGVVGADLMPLSANFLEDGAAFRLSLGGAGDAGGLGPWLEYFLGLVADCAARASGAVREFAALREEHRAVIAKRMGHAVGRGLQVLDHLIQHPIATVAEIRSVTGTSYVATNHLVAKLVELGILEEVTGFRRNRHFQYGSYLRIVGSALPAPKPHAKPAPRRPPRPKRPAAQPQRPRPRRRPASKPLADHLL